MAVKPTEKKSSPEVADEAAREGHVAGTPAPKVTVAEGEVLGERATTAPGDAPADTWDPKEMVSTVVVSGDKLAEASKEGVGAVVGYVKTGTARINGTLDPNRDTSKDRYEEYEVQGVTVRRNMETGESTRV